MKRDREAPETGYDVGSWALVSRLLEGDPDMIDHVRAWIRDAFIPYRTRLAEDREDLEQEILLELLGALREGRFDGRSQLKTYVKTFVHHKAIDRLRAASRRVWIEIEGLDLPSAEPSAFDEMARSESLQIALDVLAQMPESCRELWRMLQAGMRYQEMSRRLGVAEGTLRARVLRCRRRALEARQRILSKISGNEPPGSTTK